MRISLPDLFTRLSEQLTEAWPTSDAYVEAFAHGSMRIGIYAPKEFEEVQAHLQDEIYIIASGTADLESEGKLTEVRVGDALFLPAGTMHRFDRVSDDFATWVVFWGPEGGEL
jgi:mannose-6-phosphate isomerase-like protein (cupin superfamily)